MLTRGKINEAINAALHTPHVAGFYVMNEQLCRVAGFSGLSRRKQSRLSRGDLEKPVIARCPSPPCPHPQYVRPALALRKLVSARVHETKAQL